MNPLEIYIRELYEIRSTGAAVPETSYYPALANLFNEVGKTLKPKVKCIVNLKNRRAGLPDGGLFNHDKVLTFLTSWQNVLLQQPSLTGGCPRGPE